MFIPRSSTILLQVNGMGIVFSFCCSDAYFRRQNSPREEDSYEKVSFIVSIVENIKQNYFMRKKRVQERNKEGEQKQQKMGQELTLEDWLLKSPIAQKYDNCNGDHCGFKHRSNSDYRSVARESAYFSNCGECSLSLEQLLNDGDYRDFSAGYSISLENLLKDENVDEKETGFNSLTRSHSSEVRKRVRFRLPEVSETIILHPLEKDLNEF
ncbi:unnamed protein product [Sphenostylis stenocarpa]|uniref:Uncharacterized protein n=1 Tax=Sphenostylis stenocarpa TaxID=92480 RepID=A0AA86SRX8_9FABA|nr:unnamed protein product [Sphenostylis stenocarpa]